MESDNDNSERKNSDSYRIDSALNSPLSCNFCLNLVKDYLRTKKTISGK